MTNILFKSWHLTPLGKMFSLSDEKYLYLLEFENRRKLAWEIKQLKNNLDCEIIDGETTVSRQLREELQLYFSESGSEFKVAFRVFGTPFQQSVWSEVSKIPLGQTRTYKEIAQIIGCGSPISVGAANGANQLALIIPCHRLTRVDGGLAGYAAGLDKKAWLIEHEKKGSQSASRK